VRDQGARNRRGILNISTHRALCKRITKKRGSRGLAREKSVISEIEKGEGSEKGETYFKKSRGGRVLTRLHNFVRQKKRGGGVSRNSEYLGPGIEKKTPFKGSAKGAEKKSKRFLRWWGKLAGKDSAKDRRMACGIVKGTGINSLGRETV